MLELVQPPPLVAVAVYVVVLVGFAKTVGLAEPVYILVAPASLYKPLPMPLGDQVYVALNV